METYAIFGLGIVWNSVAYKETVTAADIDPDSTLVLPNHTTSQLGWDLGVGHRVALSENVYASLEYIYAILGDGSPGAEVDPVRLRTAPAFLLQSQSLLLGLNLRF